MITGLLIFITCGSAASLGMEDALIDAVRWGDLTTAGSCLACCIIWLYSITSGTYTRSTQLKTLSVFTSSKLFFGQFFFFFDSFLNTKSKWLPVCVNEGGGDVAGGRGGKVNGSHPPPPPPLCHPWSERAAARTCLEERLGWVQQIPLWCWRSTNRQGDWITHITQISQLLLMMQEQST